MRGLCWGSGQPKSRRGFRPGCRSVFVRLITMTQETPSKDLKLAPGELRLLRDIVTAATDNGVAVSCLSWLRQSEPALSIGAISKPAICIVLQGAKVLTTGSQLLKFEAGEAVVCTENLNPGVAVMESTQNGKQCDAPGPLNRARDRPSLSNDRCVLTSL
jgi:hypothetical protein